jgi:hypothetical protein
MSGTEYSTLSSTTAFFFPRFRRRSSKGYSEIGKNVLLPRGNAIGVKGGVKLDHPGGGKVDQFPGSCVLALKDLRGRLERRPATRVAGRV